MTSPAIRATIRTMGPVPPCRHGQPRERLAKVRHNPAVAPALRTAIDGGNRQPPTSGWPRPLRAVLARRDRSLWLCWLLVGWGLAAVLPAVAGSFTPGAGTALVQRAQNSTWTVLGAGPIEVGTGDRIRTGDIGGGEWHGPNAVRVALGPASVLRVAANGAVLEAGEIRCEVPPAAAGFEVLAPSLRVRGQGGARYTVGVTRDGASRLTVATGEVQCAPTGGRQRWRRATAGTAWTAPVGGNRIQPATADPPVAATAPAPPRLLAPTAGDAVTPGTAGATEPGPGARAPVRPVAAKPRPAPVTPAAAPQVTVMAESEPKEARSFDAAERGPVAFRETGGSRRHPGGNGARSPMVGDVPVLQRGLPRFEVEAQPIPSGLPPWREPAPVVLGGPAGDGGPAATVITPDSGNRFRQHQRAVLGLREHRRPLEIDEPVTSQPSPGRPTPERPRPVSPAPALRQPAEGAPPQLPLPPDLAPGRPDPTLPMLPDDPRLLRHQWQVEPFGTGRQRPFAIRDDAGLRDELMRAENEMIQVHRDIMLLQAEAQVVQAQLLDLQPALRAGGSVRTKPGSDEPAGRVDAGANRRAAASTEATLRARWASLQNRLSELVPRQQRLRIRLQDLRSRLR